MTQRRVRILPARLLPTTINNYHSPLPPPPSPSSPLPSSSSFEERGKEGTVPPCPDELVSLLVVGNVQAGKTSLISSFTRHESVDVIAATKAATATTTATTTTTTTLPSDQNRHDNDDDDDDNDQQQQQSALSCSIIKYHKKDFLFANRNGCLKCLRVQLWDTTANVYNHHHVTTNNNNNNNNNKTTTTTTTTISTMMEDLDWWKVVWNKVSMICIVVSLVDPFEQVLQNVRKWHAWCHSCQNQQQQQQQQQQTKDIVIFFHQADVLSLPVSLLLPTTTTSTAKDNDDECHSQMQRHLLVHHPTDWMLLGGRIADLCRSLTGVTSWHFTSSCLQHDDLGNSVDTAFRHILGHKGRPCTLLSKPPPLSNNNNNNNNNSGTLSESTTTAESVTSDNTNHHHHHHDYQ